MITERWTPIPGAPGMQTTAAAGLLTTIFVVPPEANGAVVGLGKSGDFGYRLNGDDGDLDANNAIRILPGQTLILSNREQINACVLCNNSADITVQFFTGSTGSTR